MGVRGWECTFALTLQKTAYSSVIEQKLGIISSGYDNTLVDSIYFEPEFMLGGDRLIRSQIRMMLPGRSS